MSDPDLRPRFRWAAPASLLAAGVIAGGVLAGTLSANAASGTTPTPSGSSSSSQAPPANFPAHGSAAHEDQEKPVTGTNASKAQAAAVKSVAQSLGNRPATCRKYYIHPAVIEAYEDGSLFPVMQQGVIQDSEYAGLGLRPDEYAVMVIVARYQEEMARGVRKIAA